MISYNFRQNVPTSRLDIPSFGPWTSRLRGPGTKGRDIQSGRQSGYPDCIPTQSGYPDWVGISRKFGLTHLPWDNPENWDIPI